MTLPTELSVLLPAAIALGALATAARRADWRRATDDTGAHLFWGCATGTAVLWHFGAGPTSGLHLLGATVACALLGLRLGLVALALGIAIRHVGDAVPWATWPAAFVLGALCPALIAQALLVAARRAGDRLGPLPLVAAAFAAGGLSMAAAVLLQTWTGLAPSAVPVRGGAELAALAALLAIAEANLSAGVLATIAAQRPAWLPGGRRH